MASDEEERPRVLGFPVGAGPARRDGADRVLGMPLDWFGPIDRSWLAALFHPRRSWRRWRRHRRLGPYALDDDEATGDDGGEGGPGSGALPPTGLP
ncbi:MAG TPA: hypothetical protein VMB82_11595 [Acidimicrobiales bacterium]|nr:hypothetical protein [Acidimicrobiales bacterium]